jgi:hypothetical protein
MKQLRSSIIVNFSFGLLFLSLLMPAAMAQQEVAPERFDRSWDTAHPHRPLSQHKTTKRSKAGQARKAVPAKEKLDSQKTQENTQTQSASREVIDRGVKQ